MVRLLATLICCFCLGMGTAAETLKIGLNYPETGPYATMGLDQLRAAQMAADEINASGGIGGSQIELVIRDSASDSQKSTDNARELIDQHGVKMVFGGSSSGVAVAVGKVCQEAGVPFFGTLTYSTATTGPSGHRYVFRECYDSWAAANVLADYMTKNFSGKKFFYITADYTWGHTTEASFRELTGTQDTGLHQGVKTIFPGATQALIAKAVRYAKLKKPDVLVLVLFGEDMEIGITEATKLGLKENMQIIVPNLTLGMAEGAGPDAMEGVVGALPWCWRLPQDAGFERGKQFVDDFEQRYGGYPSTSGASAYTILYEYRDAVARAGSTDGAAVVKALEGHSYQLLKDQQTWRAFDHQSIQTVYAVKCRPAAEVKASKHQQDYFEVISQMDGEAAFISEAAWKAARVAAGKEPQLESLP